MQASILYLSDKILKKVHRFADECTLVIGRIVKKAVARWLIHCFVFVSYNID